MNELDISLNGSADAQQNDSETKPVINLPTIGIEDIKAEAELLLREQEENSQYKGLFTVMPANSWIEQAKDRPAPKMLFGEFWFEGELCILFADTNLGKSILAVQIGDSISRGQQIPGFKLDSISQPVLYFDFELSDKQFESRYSIDFEQHHNFDESFLRSEINPNAEVSEKLSFEDYLNLSMEKSIIEKGVKVLIIDNLTYLKTETERAKDALPLMKHLKALKSKYGISILALAHTPKRDLSKPITKNDLQGSKMLINFCDSSFTIGENQNDKNVRYLKQIKARNCEIKYDAENVIVCQIHKPGNFLQFEFLNYGKEREHLREVSEEEKNELVAKVVELVQTDPGITAYAIAKLLCKDESKFKSFQVKINRIVNKIRNTSSN